MMTLEDKAKNALIRLQAMMAPRIRPGVKPKLLFERGLSCEHAILDFRFEGASLSDMMNRLLIWEWNKKIYHPYRWEYRPLPYEQLMFSLTIGRADLLHCIVGSPTDRRSPTLRVVMRPQLQHMYGSERLCLRVLNSVLSEQFDKWHLHGKFKSITLSHNLPCTREGLLIWRENLYERALLDTTSIGDCYIINRTQQYSDDYGISLDGPFTSIERTFQPKGGIEFFGGVQRLDNPFKLIDLFQTSRAANLFLANPVFMPALDGFSQPELFARTIRSTLTYPQRKKLIELLRQEAAPLNLSDSQWKHQLKLLLLRHKPLNWYAG